MPDVRDASPLTRAILLAAGLLLVGLVFRELVTLLVAVLMTVLIAIPLGAVADRLERSRLPVPRWLGALLALLLGLAFFVGVLAVVIPEFVAQTDAFVEQVPELVDSLRERLNDIGGEGTGAEAQQFLERYTDNPGEFIGPLASIGLNVASAIAAILLILITAYYMAVNPQPLLEGVTSLVAPPRREWARSVMERLREAWVGWMQGVLVDMLISFVVVVVRSRLIGFDRSLEEAARDLGAGPFETFRLVTLPLLAPGIVAAALLAFALSIDDFVISNFNAGDFVTFPLFIFGASQRGIPVEVYSMATILFLVTVAAMILTVWQQRRAERLAARRPEEGEPYGATPAFPPAPGAAGG